MVKPQTRDIPMTYESNTDDIRTYELHTNYIRVTYDYVRMIYE